jgi:alpha-tubulin suppressor-like RCC1 family protein
VIVALAAACDSTDPFSNDPLSGGEQVASVEIWPTDLVLPLRAQLPLCAFTRNRAGEYLGDAFDPTFWLGGVTWAVSDRRVLDVDALGLVTAIGVGAAVITATHDAASDADPAHVIALDLTSVTAGSSHACALTSDGTPYCWGANFEGTLGTDVPEPPVADGTRCFNEFPKPVVSPVRFRHLSAGTLGRCGLTDAGAAYCWGYTPTMGYTPTVPTLVSGLPPLADITVGYHHSCGLAPDGSAYCWGGNRLGQLGAGDTLSHAAPVQVIGGHRFLKVSAGPMHTCGLTTDGEVYCWGSNELGALARDRADSLSATPSLVPGDSRYIDVAAGTRFSCAITTEHRAACWGSNGYGKLGNSDFCTLDDPDLFFCLFTTEPVFVAGGLAFDSIAAGESHTCALTATGAAYCWGRGEHGQLGVPAPATTCPGVSIWIDPHPCSQAPVAVDTDLTFQSLHIGGDFTCAMDAHGDAYCWGSDYRSQLGTGSYSIGRMDFVSPMLVAGQPERANGPNIH